MTVLGGGEGMVLKPEPLFECVESLGVRRWISARMMGRRGLLFCFRRKAGCLRRAWRRNCPDGTALF